MKYKPDWDDAKERYIALWQGSPVDRPCMAVAVTGQTSVKSSDHWDIQDLSAHPPPNAEARWLDPDWVVADALRTMAGTWWGGEAIPSYILMAGWLISLGGDPHFDYRTIWFKPFTVDFTKPHPFHHNPADPWYQRFERLYLAMIKAAGQGDFLVGAPSGLPAHDLISMHMGPQEFMFALMDHPDWMAKTIDEAARESLAARRHLVSLVRDRHDFWYGNAGWMPFWAPAPFISTQSDVSCMLSPDHFEQFVVPELDLNGAEFGAMWYHLDGSDALQHLPRLLQLPYIRVIQYVPRPAEPPNGVQHLPMYKQIQKAGRIVHIQVAPDQVEPLCRALDPRLLVLEVSWMCQTPAEANDLLSAAKRWTTARFVRT
jgi:hypothetical protein